VTSVFAAAFVIKHKVSLRHLVFIVATNYKIQHSQLLEKQTITNAKLFIFIKTSAKYFAIAFVIKHKVSQRHLVFIVATNYKIQNS
jgi:hypothetical protein